MAEHPNTTESRSQRNSAKDTSCRRCDRAISRENEHFPFCSDRCRMADLNAWFEGSYKISRDIKDSDLDTVD